MRVGPQRDHRVRVTEDRLHLLDRGAAGDQRRREEMPEIVGVGMQHYRVYDADQCRPVAC
jgi:hypothetical protein